MAADRASTARAGRPTLALVGPGRVGTALAAALGHAGHRLTAIAGRAPGAVARMRPWLGGGDPPAELGAAEALHAADITLIAVPDDALAPLARTLGEAQASLAGRTVVHVSGRYGTAVLDPLAARGATPLAIHPAMTFAGDVEADLGHIIGAAFAVTASSDAGRARGEAMVRAIGGVPFAVAEADRTLYHAALTHGANHLATLAIQAGDMLRQAGVEAPAAVLGPLLRAALDNALARGPQAATGPVVRGDADTVRAHLAAIAGIEAGIWPDTAPAYRAMATAGLQIARSAGAITPDQAQALTDALAAPMTEPTAKLGHCTPGIGGS